MSVIISVAVQFVNVSIVRVHLVLKWLSFTLRLFQWLCSLLTLIVSVSLVLRKQKWRSFMTVTILCPFFCSTELKHCHFVLRKHWERFSCSSETSGGLLSL
jgi:hypothetical protein